MSVLARMVGATGLTSGVRGERREAPRVRWTPGLGTAEWKRGGLRTTGAADGRGRAQGGFAGALNWAWRAGCRWCWEAGHCETLGFS